MSAHFRNTDRPFLLTLFLLLIAILLLAALRPSRQAPNIGNNKQPDTIYIKTVDTVRLAVHDTLKIAVHDTLAIRDTIRLTDTINNAVVGSVDSPEPVIIEKIDTVFVEKNPVDTPLVANIDPIVPLPDPISVQTVEDSGSGIWLILGGLILGLLLVFFLFGSVIFSNSVNLVQQSGANSLSKKEKDKVVDHLESLELGKMTRTERLRWVFTPPAILRRAPSQPQPGFHYTDGMAILFGIVTTISLWTFVPSFPAAAWVWILSGLIVGFAAAVYFRGSALMRWGLGCGGNLIGLTAVAVYALYYIAQNAAPSSGSGGSGTIITSAIVVFGIGLGIALISRIIGVNTNIISQNAVANAQQAPLQQAPPSNKYDPDKLAKAIKIKQPKPKKKEQKVIPKVKKRIRREPQKLKPGIFKESEWWLKVDLARLGSIELNSQNMDEEHEFLPFLMDCETLQLLYLNDNLFEEIPFEVMELDHLEILDMSDNNINEILPDIEFMEELKVLILTNNNISALPRELANLPNLTLLAIKDNPLPVSEVMHLKKLAPKLTIEYDEHPVLAEEQAEAEKPSEESLSDREIISKRLAKYKVPENVTYLGDLFDAGLSSLPTDLILPYKNLKDFFLSYNKFSEFPPVLYELKQLQEINLGENPIREIPDDIVKLKRLKMLELSDCPIEKISPKITSLTKLEHLDISGNKLQSFPDFVLKMPQLKKLNISSMKSLKAEDFPKELLEMTNLQDLNIGFMDLGKVPKVITQMKFIESLNISSNKLTALPEELTEFENLKELEIGYNRSLAIPNHILYELRNLEKLVLSGMDLRGLPSAITNLSRLRFLYISYNKFETLPSEIRQLKNLQTILSQGNQLTTLPDWIGEMSEIRYLYLDSNKLTHLPDSLAKLDKLYTLSLKKNNFSEKEKKRIRKMLPQVKSLMF